MVRAPFALLSAAALTIAVGAAGAQEESDEQVPPNVPKQPTYVAPAERDVDPTTYDRFEAWLSTHGPIPGVENGGFLAREVLGRPLLTRSGDEIGQIQNIALDEEARARFFLVRLDDDSLRAVPVASLIVDDEDRLFTEMSEAQVEELPLVGG